MTQPFFIRCLFSVGIALFAGFGDVRDAAALGVPDSLCTDQDQDGICDDVDSCFDCDSDLQSTLLPQSPIADKAMTQPVPTAATAQVTCPNICRNSNYYIFGCDDRAEGHLQPPVPVGRFRDGCTGTLIAPDAVLTAAHCLIGTDNQWKSSVGDFELHRYRTDAFRTITPYRTGVRRAYVPNHYNGNSIALENKMWDYAVVLLDSPITSVTPAKYAHYNFNKQLQGGIAWSYGYPSSWSGGWVISAGGKLRSTDYRGDHGMLFVDTDAESGQSGSPVMGLFPNAGFVVLGVLIGAPDEFCESEQTIWASRLVKAVVADVDAWSRGSSWGGEHLPRIKNY